MTARVISAQFLADRLGLGPLSDRAAETTTSLQSAIEGACTFAEKLLRTPLSLALNVTDIFLLNVSRYWHSLPNDLAPLRLSRGFVQADSLALTHYRLLEEAMSNTNGEPIAVSSTLRDYANGIIRVRTDLYDKRYIRAVYNAGFQDAALDSGGNEVVDPAVPDVLKEAIVAKAIVILNQEQTTNRSREQETVVAQSVGNFDDLSLSPLSRINVPFVFNPL